MISIKPVARNPFSSASQITSISSPVGAVYEYRPRCTLIKFYNFDSLTSGMEQLGSFKI